MDFIKNAANQFGGNQQGQQGQQSQQSQQSVQHSAGSSEQKREGGIGGFLGNLKNQANSAAGGGPESEKDEDLLDKGVDFVQEKFLGQGPQDNESAIEQAKDEQISDYIRGQYKKTTGTDFPIKDKPTRFG